MNDELNTSIEVFVSAIARIKSQTAPHHCDRLGDIYILHDEPNRRDPRKTEVVTSGKDPAFVVDQLKRAGLGWHYLCDINPDPNRFEEVRAQYKSLGYRALSTEWMFLHEYDQIPKFFSSPEVREVKNQAEADAIPQLSRRRLRLRTQSRDFRIWDETRDYGYVRSMDIADSCWVQGLYVYADVRRRGYGKALMSSLLQSDHRLGKRRSVLLASTTGATVYPQLGYRQIGIIQMFCPTRR